MKPLKNILNDAPGYRVYARIGKAFMDLYRSDREDKDYEALGGQGQRELLNEIVKYPIGTRVYFLETGGMFKGGVSIWGGEVADLEAVGDRIYYTIHPGEHRPVTLNDLCVFGSIKELTDFYKDQFVKLSEK